MRVLHVVEVSIGGVISVINAYAQWQASAGHDVHVLAPAEAEILAGSRHEWQPRRRAPHRFPGDIRTLRQTVSLVQPDVVHLHSFFPGLLGRILPTGGSPRPAVVYQPHSWTFDAAPTPFGRHLAGAWERVAARRSDGVIVNCRDEGDEGTSHGVTVPIHPVGVPVDTAVFRPASPTERETARHEFGLSERSVLLCVGRIARQKGQDRLVAEWARDPIPDSVLVLLGAGDPEHVERLAGPEWGRSVLAPGAVSDVRAWLHACDLVVAPSRWEGQAVAVAEALSCGRAVVATQVNGAREAIEDGPQPAAGVVVGQNDMTAFVAACRQRLADPALLAQETAVARSRAEQMFARDEVMLKVTAAYQAALTSARPDSVTEPGR